MVFLYLNRNKVPNWKTLGNSLSQKILEWKHSKKFQNIPLQRKYIFQRKLLQTVNFKIKLLKYLQLHNTELFPVCVLYLHDGFSWDAKIFKNCFDNCLIKETKLTDTIQERHYHLLLKKRVIPPIWYCRLIFTANAVF